MRSLSDNYLSFNNSFGKSENKKKTFSYDNIYGSYLKNVKNNERKTKTINLNNHFCLPYKISRNNNFQFYLKNALKSVNIIPSRNQLSLSQKYKKIFL